MTKELENFMTIINDNQDVIDDQEFGSATVAKPADVSREQIQQMMNNLSDDEKAALLNNTNNTEVIGFCAKGPHVGKYVVETMGIETLECETKVDNYLGQKLPIKLPAKPTFPWDGYALRLPDGTQQYVRKDRMVDWLLNNTLGRIVGGDEGRMLRVTEKRVSSQNGLAAEKSSLTITRKNISPSNPDTIIPTYEVDTEANGTPKPGVKRTVVLDAGEAKGEDGKKLNLRGTVENFPVFRRKAEFVEALGQISTGRGTGGGKIAKGVDTEDAIFEYLELLAKHKGQQA